MIGPTFVISSYSRSRRRQARRSMSSALDPELRPDEFLEFRGRRPRLIDVREARLGEVLLPAALPVEFRCHRPDELRGVDRDVPPSRHDELHVVRRFRPIDAGRARLRRGRLRHGHHEADALRDLVLHDRPGAFRGPDLLPRLRRGLFVRRPLGELAQLLPLRHEPFRGGDDLVRRHTGDVRGAPEIVALLPHRVERSFARGVFQSDDAVLDARRPEELDQGHVARPGHVGPAAGLHVPLRDLDDPQLAPGDGAALVQSEPELLLRHVAGHHLRTDLMVAKDLRVRELLDPRDLGFREAAEWVMSSRARSRALWGPAWQAWLARALRAAPGAEWVGGWVRHQGLPG